ncbi:hypothetical protein PFISCL1PPCAC_6749, partial [Pristionchus fissidentatus]
FSFSSDEKKLNLTYNYGTYTFWIQVIQFSRKEEMGKKCLQGGEFEQEDVDKETEEQSSNKSATISVNPPEGGFTSFRIDNEQVVPISGIDPFTILDPIGSRSNELDVDVVLLSGKLKKLLSIEI